MTECRYYEMCARRAGSRDLPRSCDARHCWMFRPMPDVDALLRIADELENEGLEGWACGPLNVGEYASKIREALGEAQA